MPNQKTLHFALFLFVAVFCDCSTKKTKTEHTTAANTNLTNLKYTVEEVPAWISLFKRTSGWYGADGIFAIPLNGIDNVAISDTSTNLILFSDSMIGEIENGKIKGKPHMVHNTVAILKGGEPKNENINFYWDKDDKGEPETIFIPHLPSATKEDYYWLGDGFVNTETNTTYIFAYRMRNMNPKDDWSFRQMKQDIIAFPNGTPPPFKNHRQIETRLQFVGANPGDDGQFGAAIFVNTQYAGAPKPDGYVYVYGVKGKAKNLIVARVLPKEFEDFSKWNFWDGKNWNADMQRVAKLTDGVSNELSLSPLPDGRYVLVFQLNGMSNVVAMRIGASPVGPFGDVIKLYECKESQENKHYTTYNAKAHPSLSKPGELLITYNVNSMDYLNEIQKNPQLYRPRFIRLKFE
ncbi:MAG: DUF4185 domain-containing protein [Parafilimonas sp.]